MAEQEKPVGQRANPIGAAGRRCQGTFGSRAEFAVDNRSTTPEDMVDVALRVVIRGPEVTGFWINAVFTSQRVYGLGS
jgi:hypothetical protein